MIASTMVHSRVAPRADVIAWGEPIPGTSVIPIYHANGDLWFVLSLDDKKEWQREEIDFNNVAWLHHRADASDTLAKCYFIGAPDGPVKIGYSIDVAARFQAIQACSPVALAVLAIVAGGKDREIAYHAQFADQRLHGEWFARTPELNAVIEHHAPARADGGRECVA